MYTKQGLAKADDKEIDQCLEALADHAVGSATDLAALFGVYESPACRGATRGRVRSGSGIATSGEMSGEQLVRRYVEALGTSRASVYDGDRNRRQLRFLLGEVSACWRGGDAGGQQAERAHRSCLGRCGRDQDPDHHRPGDRLGCRPG
ncbi:MAG: hypothetical protein R3B13_38260 [Polyangiaceae bacterium]